MSAEAGFRVRAREVGAYLRSLKSLERNIKPGKSFYRATAAITASRASSFIMIYNSVEFAAREAVVNLRTDISARGGGFEKVHVHWQRDIIKAHFYDRLRQGTNFMDFLNDVVTFIPGSLNWKEGEKELPFAGNIDHEELLSFTRKIGYRWRPPKISAGGADLQLIRKLRNDLAHGNESFENIGAQYTTDDVAEKFERIRKFILSFLRSVERYKTRQLYLQ